MTQDARVQEFVTSFNALRSEVEKVIVGHREIITHVLFGMFAGGHVLLEGVPGLGKTLLIKTLAEGLELKFSRIQFTPDLMPADIIGTNIIVEDAEGRKHFQFQYGPIFANILLADEINRATPKTQSALLEGMQEGSVTVGGASRPLPAPFFVLATQNAIIDRTTHATSATVHRVMSGPNVVSFRELIREVPVATHVRDLASMIVMATHPEWDRSPEPARRFVRYGASPRGAQALILGAKVRALAEGRYNVSVDDLKTLAAPALRHRIILNFEGEAEAVDIDSLIDDIVQSAETLVGQAKEPFLR